MQFGERGSVNDLILNSPFYSGRTTYGGASSASYRRSLGSASLSSSPANSEKLARHTIKVGFSFVLFFYYGYFISLCSTDLNLTFLYTLNR